MLSEFDKSFLSTDQQKQITNLTKLLETKPEQVSQVHDAVEAIRASKGYSGGVEGNEYIKLETPEGSMPETPDFSGFGSRPEMDWSGSDYAGDIKNSINDIKNIVDTGFKYDSTKDKSFLAFKNQMERMGNQSYQSDMASASARTGGTTSSWGQAVASQSRNAYLQKATDAIPEFENLAYTKYRGNLQDRLALLNEYQQEDATAYGRYVDQYENEVKSYLNDLDLAEAQYNAEIDKYNIALDEKRTEIDNAWERTNVTGYVSNQDASILGVPAGTASKDVRERKADYDEYLNKSAKELEDYKKKLDAKNKSDREQAQWELDNLPQKGTEGGEATETEGIDLDDKDRTALETYTAKFNSRMDNLYKSFIDPTYKEVTDTESMEKAMLDEIKVEIKNLEASYNSVEDKHGQFMEVTKMYRILNSRYFDKYADDKLKEDKKDFMIQYNKVFGTNSNTTEKTVAPDAWME